MMFYGLLSTYNIISYRPIWDYLVPKEPRDPARSSGVLYYLIYFQTAPQSANEFRPYFRGKHIILHYVRTYVSLPSPLEKCRRKY